MSKPDLAQLLAGAAILLLIAVLLIAHRTVAVADPAGEPARTVRRSAFSAIVVGRDHRASTSKSVLLAWTLAIAYGLLALLIAKWLGDGAGWDRQLRNGLQEEYLVLLGGPFAAAVLAKTAAVGQAQRGRTPAAPGFASAKQLVADDAGDTELGDFQYVVFSLIGLAYFFGTFLGHLGAGFPDLPPILTGLMLTSAGGYTAKKLIQQARPAVTSAVPASMVAGGEGLLVYGTDLIVPASVAPDGTAQLPIVAVGGRRASVTEFDHVLGADRLTVTIARDAAPGRGTLAVVRADGVPALGPAGADGISFHVLERRPRRKRKGR